MEKNSAIEMSIIVPVYNVEDYLPQCIDSLISQGDLQLEIILINDGSTDGSGVIADQYAKRYSRIKVIHQKNGGASAARNVGLELAQGEYIAFIDSDDWVEEKSLFGLYQEAVKHHADIVMGKMLYCYQNKNQNGPFNPAPCDILNILFSGKECFVRLVKAFAYAPMACHYIYRRSYLEKIQVCFEEGITHEDELWCPIVLCQAEKMIVAEHVFYYYRQREGSVMRTTNLNKRLDNLFFVIDRLFEFSDRFEFSGENRELKNWWYVNVFRLYFWTLGFLSDLKDSSYIVPTLQLDRFWRNCFEMMPEPQKICKKYFRIGETELKRYTDWRVSDWVASITPQIMSGKKLMLIYNTMNDEDLSLKIEDVPADWVITTDRRYFQQADVVVFHVPDLQQEFVCDLVKPQDQVWVAWCMGAEENYPWIKNSVIRKRFDLWMNYRQDADVLYPYYRYEYLDQCSQKVSKEHPQNKTCMFISELPKENDGMEYLKVLMEHIEIDSYGSLYNNKKLPTDRKLKKMDFYRKHKFIIVFENAIEQDYVTKRFYEPLIAGSVPIYFGAPNIHDFSPGDHCFVDVRQFDNPQSLAHFIHACYEDDALYDKFFEWKSQPLRQSFLQKVEVQKEHPLVRLCRKIDEKI